MKPIEIKYFPSGRVRVETNTLAGLDIFPVSLKIYNKISGYVIWESILHDNNWSESPIFTENCIVSIVNKNGKEIIHEEVPDTAGDMVQFIFHLWAKENFGATGVVIGSHDGTSGEWVNPVLRNELRAVLVEPTKSTFDTLKSHWGNKINVELVNNVITPSGGKIEFFECLSGGGYTNSLSKDFILNFVGEENITTNYYDSISVKNIVEKYNPKWIHIDAEGTDLILINSIFDLNTSLHPDLIIFEHQNQSVDDLERIKERSHGLGYNYLIGEKMNTIIYR